MSNCQIRATARNGKIFIDTASDEARAKLLKMPSIIELPNGGLMLSGTMIYFRRLRKIFGDDILWKGEEAETLRQWADRYDLAHRYREAEDVPPPPVEKVPAWHHQKRGFWFAYHLPAAILDEKMGAGKTKQAIDVICNRNHRKVIVSTTASAVDDWPEHISKHSTKPYHVLALSQQGKNANWKADRIEEAFALYEWLIVVLSHDTVWRPPLGQIIKSQRKSTFHKDIGLLGRLKWDCWIIDEIHHLAEPQSRRGLFAFKLSERIPHKIGLTGTIVKDKPENIYGSFRTLDPGIFGLSYPAFLERYCIFNRAPTDYKAEAEERRAETLPGIAPAPMQNAPRFIVGYQRLDELSALMKTICYHVQETGLDLPVPIDTFSRCYLGPKALRMYRELEDQSFTEIAEGREIEAKNVLVKLIRLQQITSGFVGELEIDPNTGEIDAVNITEVDDSKERLLEETLRNIDADDPIVVVCRYKHDIEIIRRTCKRVGRTVMEQSGKRKDKRKFIDATGGEVLAAQIQSACEAIDLTRSRYMVWYSLGFSLYQYEQMRAREDRPGQTRQPHYRHLLAQDSIDEKVYRTLQKKQKVVESIIGQVRSGLQGVSYGKAS